MSRGATFPERWAKTPEGGPESPGKHEAEGLSSILSRCIKRNRIKERIEGGSIFAAWPELVGENLATSTRPVRLAGGILTVEVASAPLLQELSTFRRSEILDAVRARDEFAGVRDLRFRAGRLP
jgi:predicted nucleic acid-binding Zn ribbon protein